MIKETTWRELNDEFSTPLIIGSAICCFLLFSLILFSCCIARKRRTRAFECLFRRVLAISINWPCDGRFHFVDFGIVFCAMYIVLFSCPYDSPVFFFFLYSIYCSPPRRFRLHPRTDERTRMQIAFICKTYGITCIHAQWSRSLHAIPLWFVAYVDNDALFANVQALFTLRSQPILRYERPLTHNIVHVSCTYP